jgi:hypothetical protein
LTHEFRTLRVVQKYSAAPSVASDAVPEPAAILLVTIVAAALASAGRSLP